MSLLRFQMSDGSPDALGRSGEFTADSPGLDRSAASWGSSFTGGSPPERSLASTAPSLATSATAPTLRPVANPTRPGSGKQAGGAAAAMRAQNDLRRILKIISDVVYSSPSGVQVRAPRMTVTCCCLCSSGSGVIVHDCHVLLLV